MQIIIKNPFQEPPPNGYSNNLKYLKSEFISIKYKNQKSSLKIHFLTKFLFFFIGKKEKKETVLGQDPDQDLIPLKKEEKTKKRKRNTTTDHTLLPPDPAPPPKRNPPEENTKNTAKRKTKKAEEPDPNPKKEEEPEQEPNQSNINTIIIKVF